jgi:hypothetical protein
MVGEGANHRTRGRMRSPLNWMNQWGQSWNSRFFDQTDHGGR